MFGLWAGPPVIMPGSGSQHLSMLIWPVPLKCYTNPLFLKVCGHMCSKWPRLLLWFQKCSTNLCCAHTRRTMLRKVWVLVRWDAQTGSAEMECLFYVKLNKISLWASLLPVPLSVLCSFPFANKAVSPRCINAHQRPQSSCFATGYSRTGEAKV